MPDHGSKSDISFAGRFTASAIAACFAELCTIPLDTAKVRLQLQKNVAAGDAAPKYRGLLGTAATIAREEGAAALWKGIVPGLHRQCIYGGLRISLYEPVKSFYVGQDHVGRCSRHLLSNHRNNFSSSSNSSRTTSSSSKCNRTIEKESNLRLQEQQIAQEQEIQWVLQPTLHHLLHPHIHLEMDLEWLAICAMFRKI